MQQGRWQQFRAGLADCSLRTLLLSLLVAATMLAAIEVALELGLPYRLHYERLVTSSVDDWTLVTWKVKRLPRNKPIKDHVFVIGSSAMREALIDDESLAQAVSAKLDKKIRVDNLGTSAQQFAETLQIVEQLPDAQGALLVIGVSPQAFALGKDAIRYAFFGVRIPFYSFILKDALERTVDDVPTVLPINIIRYRPLIGRYFRNRMTRRVWFKPIQYHYHRYSDADPLVGKALEERIEIMTKMISRYPGRRPLNQRLLVASIRLAKEKGYDVLLCDMPRHPIVEEKLVGTIAFDYYIRLIRIANVEKVPLVSFHRELEFPAEYFYDQIHFVARARPIFQTSLVDTIATHWGNR